MRIASFLPGATEIAFALGFGDEIVGVTHECDYPSEARTKPVLVRSLVPTGTLSPSEIHSAVGERVSKREPLYEVDLDALRAAQPDLVLAQELCDVCATPWATVVEAVRQVSPEAKFLNVSPKRITQVLEDVCRVAVAAGCPMAGEVLTMRLRSRINEIRARSQGSGSLPRVVCLEWTDPLIVAGHWVPEMIRHIGAMDPLGEEGKPARRVTWDEVVQAKPEVLLVMPCGFDAEHALAQVPRLVAMPGWADLPCVKRPRVWAVDANAYFSRPGPRLVEGIEILGKILHPARGPWNVIDGTYRRWEG
ncbi:MAG: cobalamin-binding protein [Planctomycetota bacterium]